MVLLPFTRPLLLVIDNNELLHDNIHSVVNVRPPLHPIRNPRGVSIVGTFNDIVLLAFRDYTCYNCQLTLYNPLTCASKILVAMGPSSQLRHGLYVFGFGYGESTNDLKSRPPQYLTRDFFFSADKVGKFVNGVLYWTISGFRILALNVKEMVFSKTKLPYELKEAWSLILGSIDGCLCMINKIDAIRFDLWVSKDQGGIEISWLKARSFAIRLEASNLFIFWATQKF
ncbi:hypothetical protein QVD17_36184 [Tagetes erecta]|uniref:F-box associated domain-containing protein n=1 Tax=Tagetes erecta TaxID=13708 RepID=A0AAD8JRW3_TARER|nr:hypothetical protein QVD17_36184 [Tagetes erecta]